MYAEVVPNRRNITDPIRTTGVFWKIAGFSPELVK